MRYKAIKKEKEVFAQKINNIFKNPNQHILMYT